MPEDFYKNEIAPYASSYFKKVESNPFLSSARKADLSNSLLDTVEKAKEQREKSDDRSLERELALTRLSGQRLALEEARYDSQLKRDAIEAAPVIESQFEEILNSGTGKGEQQAALSKLAMRNANAFTLSPALSNKYRFAMKSIETPEAAFTPFQEFQARRGIANDEKADIRHEQDQLDKQDKEARAAAEKERERIDKIVNVEFVDDDGLPDATGKPKPRSFKSPAHRENLLDLVAQYSPAELEQADKLSDADLFKRASLLRRKLLHSTQEDSKPAERPYSFK